jgi:hypothetical protein
MPEETDVQETESEEEPTPEQLRWAGLQLERLEAEQCIVMVSGDDDQPEKAARALRDAAKEKCLAQVAIVEAPRRDRFGVEQVKLSAELKGARRQLLLGRAQRHGTRDSAQEVLAAALESIGRGDVGVAVVPMGVALDEVSEDVMREHGWVRASEITEEGESNA